MAVIEYTLKENKTLGTHSWYLQAKSFSTLTCDDVAAEVVEGLGISPEMVPTIIKRYMRVVLRNVQRGHRVKLADELVLYPQISCSVKDELNQDGTVKTVATPDMINVQSAKSTIGATVSQTVQQQFAKSVSWHRVNDTDDETTGTTENGGGSASGGSSAGGNGGGSAAQTLAAPTISGNTQFTETTEVTITGPDGATIYYTTDGTTPTAEATLYSEALTLSSTTTVKAIAVKDGQTSEVTTRVFTKSSNDDGMGQD